MTEKYKMFINKKAKRGENNCTAALLVLRPSWQRVLTALGDLCSLSAEAEIAFTFIVLN